MPGVHIIEVAPPSFGPVGPMNLLRGTFIPVHTADQDKCTPQALSHHRASSRCSRAPGFATVPSNVINDEAESSWRRYFCLANTALRETFFEYSIDPY